MKKCPKCGKTYDDSWGVCLSCCSALEQTTSQEKEGRGQKPKEETPVGIIVLGWIFIVISLLNLIPSAYLLYKGRQNVGTQKKEMYEMLERDKDMTQDKKEKILKFIDSSAEYNKEVAADRMIKVNFVVHGVQYAILFIIGIGLLKHKEIARKSAIFYSIVIIPIALGLSYIVTIRSSQIMVKYFPEAQQVQQVFPATILFSLTIYALITFLIIQYLTKPIVKEQFN